MKKPRSFLGRVVAVVWQDAFMEGENDAITVQDFKPLGAGVATTYGKVVQEARDHLSVAYEVFPDGTMRNVTHIPVGMIHQVIELTDAAP